MTDAAARLKRWRDYEAEFEYGAASIEGGWEHMDKVFAFHTGHRREAQPQPLLQAYLDAPRAPAKIGPVIQFKGLAWRRVGRLWVPEEQWVVVGHSGVEWFTAAGPQCPFVIAVADGKPVAFIAACNDSHAKKLDRKASSRAGGTTGRVA